MDSWAEQNLKALDTDKYDYILTLCASCGSHIKENYPKLLQKENAVPEGVKNLKRRSLISPPSW
jgi:Fe-S oxidoreductase